MASSMKLATAAETVKIWDYPEYNLVQQFNARASTIHSSVQWSSDCQQLVSVASQSEKLLLSLFKESNVYNLEISTGIENTVACFSQTSSRLLGIGSSIGKVLLWDQKTRSAKKQYSTHESKITSIQFNWNDSYLASSSEQGFVHLHNITSGLKTGNIDVSKEGSIQNIRYSHTKKSLLGVCSSSGTISLWDTNMCAQALHYYNLSHDAPASSLSFSPVNIYLLISVGLDKKIKCYDVQTKKTIRAISCEAPLTSVDIFEDGITIAAGSTHGKVYIYDLRSCNTILNTFTAHDSSITSLTFQKSSQRVNESKKLELKYETINSNRESFDISSEDDVFSPIGSTKWTANEESVTNTLLDFEISNNSALLKKNDNEIKDAKLPCLPKQGLQKEQFNVKPSMANYFKKPIEVATKEIKKIESPKKQLIAELTPLSQEATSNVASIFPFSTPKDTHKPTLTPAISNVSRTPLSSILETGDAAIKNDISTTQNVQTMLIKQLVQDAMEEVSDQIHKEYLSLHVEMIKQFQIQLGEVHSLLKQHFSNEEQLQRQLHALQEENAQLKSAFKK